MPQIKTIRNIPDKLWRQAKAAAASQGQSLSAWIRQAIEEKLREKENNQ